MKTWILWLLVACAAWADPPQVEAIFQKTRQMNPSLVDYTAKIQVDMDTTIGPINDHPKLAGIYYYKREDHHKIELPDAPSYLKRHSNVIGFSLPSLDRYKGRVVEETELDHQPVWLIRLLPSKPHPHVEKIELWINRENYTVPQYITYYTENGKLSVQLHYTDVQGFKVFDKAQADLEIPVMFLTSRAIINYQGYSFNQGLSDELFVIPKKKH